MNRFCALIIFMLMWAVTFFLLWIIPVNSRFLNIDEAYCVCVLFVIIVAFVAYVTAKSNWKFKKTLLKSMSIRNIDSIIVLSSLSTVIGDALIYIDRAFIRGIDYGIGLRAARYEWLASVNNGSILGVLGNLLVPFSFCAIFFIIYHFEIVSIVIRIIGLLGGFGGEFIFAMLNGGRSSILLVVIFVVIICTIRKHNLKSFFPYFKGRIVFVSMCIALIVIYLYRIIYAYAGNDIEYLRISVDMLGGSLSPEYDDNPVINMIIYIVLYLFHGIYFISQIITYESFGADLNHNITLRGLLSIISRLNVFDDYKIELPDFDEGAGVQIALPGEILYDYGVLGYLSVCVLLGISLGVVLKLLNLRECCNTFGLFFVIFVLFYLYVSMIQCVGGYPHFWFIIYALLIMELIIRFKYGKCSWLKIKRNDLNECEK